jgi:hypothetical protein
MNRRTVDLREDDMVCHELRFIFVHVPKTAGMSIESFFLRHLDPTRDERAKLLLGPNRDPSLGPRQLGHLRASEYVEKGHVTRDLFERYFKFAFVRNPWDRVVSEYKYRDYPGKFDFKTYLFRHWPRPAFNDLYLHTIPQYDFLHDEEGRLLVDFVGRYERLEADFGRVARRLGIEGGDLGHVNRSIHHHLCPSNLLRWIREPRTMIRMRRHMFDHYWEYYDDESREFVAEVYRKDIEAFRYAFGD